jgi:hypothetical protein
MLCLLEVYGEGRMNFSDCFSARMTKQMAVHSHVKKTHYTYLLDTFWATFCNHLFGHSDTYIIKNKTQPGRAIVHVSFSLFMKIRVILHKLKKALVSLLKLPLTSFKKINAYANTVHRSQLHKIFRNTYTATTISTAPDLHLQIIITCTVLVTDSILLVVSLWQNSMCSTDEHVNCKNT